MSVLLVRSWPLVLLLAACSAREPDDTAPSPDRGTASLEVENQNFYDMTVYVVDGVQR